MRKIGLAQHPSAPAAFVEDVHQALLLIYDPHRLAKSPLLTSFMLHHLSNPTLALRDILLEGIEALKPPDTVPVHTAAWRMYDVLRYRYIVQLPQHEIAASLALSQRHVRRYQQAALDVLTNHLIRRHALVLAPPASDATPSQSSADTTASAEPAASETGGKALTAARQELDWATSSAASETARLKDILDHVLQTVEPVLRAAHVSVETAIPDDLPFLAVHLMTMQQALVSILTVATHVLPQGRVHVRASVQDSHVMLHFEARKGAATPLPFTVDDREGLEIAGQLVSASRGRLDLHDQVDAQTLFSCTVVVPIVQPVVVLVVDDNADAHQLVQRYLQGSPYAFVGVRDPHQALARATELKPRVILMDVMLPGIDGWELLGRLREHPATHNTPVIVCTILPQERLALTLGAAGFLRKPFTRAMLLAALDRQIALLRGAH